MKIRDKIIVADGDLSSAKLLKRILKANHYDVMLTQSGTDALALVSSHCPDLIIMDIDLPDIEGTELIKRLREWSAIPIIVVSARSSEKDKVAALDIGADDYVTKPFGVSELMARIRLALRHRRTEVSRDQDLQDGIITMGDLVIDYNKHCVLKDGRNADLTQTEFRLVALLARHAGRIVTYENILRELWGPSKERDTRILRVNMANIRRKIEKNPTEPDYIFTEAGVGYYLREPE